LGGIAVAFAVLITGWSAPSAQEPAAAAGEVIVESPFDTSFVGKINAITANNGQLPAVTFSNQVAGDRQVDPLVSYGQPVSDHLHTFLGTRLDQWADIFRLFDEPMDIEAGSVAAQRGTGFPAEVAKAGQRSGYTPGIWWPTIWDAPPGREPRPVTYRVGIPTYYLASQGHGNEYLRAYPNGLSFVVDDHEISWDDASTGDFKVSFFGPAWWDGKSLTSSDHRSHVSRERTGRHTVPVPELQIYVKATVAYPDDATPLEQRLKFGNPGRWRQPHLDYIAGFREPWFLQWLLDLGPNWGHSDNVLRSCGVDMPATLSRRKLEGVRMVEEAARSAGRQLCAWTRGSGPAPTARTVGAGGWCGGAVGAAGYWLLERDGDIHRFGEAPKAPAIDLPSGIDAVAIAGRPQGDGFWVLSSDGDIHARGGAADFGRVNVAKLTKPGERATTMSAMPDGDGLWVFTSAGRILSFGSAPRAAALPGADEILALNLDGPVVSAVATPTGAGAYMVASDGGVFAVGDAEFRGSVRGQLSQLHGPPGMPAHPIVGIVSDPDGKGYWMVGRDGGVFSFDAPFRGSLPAQFSFDQLFAPINAMVPYGNGYLLIGGDGGVFTYSDKPFAGSASGQANSAVVDIATA
jgi:hypothetical protein